MRYRLLGHSGLRVSELCLGTMTLDPACVERLDTVSRIEMGFPHDFFATEMVRALSYGGMRDQIDA
jgi:aryl-alcohol dehydrogenase-like predicted oxidoreductase